LKELQGLSVAAFLLIAQDDRNRENQWQESMGAFGENLSVSWGPLPLKKDSPITVRKNYRCLLPLKTRARLAQIYKRRNKSYQVGETNKIMFNYMSKNYLLSIIIFNNKK
jgi:hypothetical protein